MNIIELKKYVKISDFMHINHYEPTSKSGKYLHYKSPLREDKKPSFWVDTEKDICGDFSTGKIGDIVNLAAAFWRLDLKAAKQNLEDMFRLGSFSFAKPKYTFQKSSTPTAATESKIYIKHVQEIQNAALLQYIEERGISCTVAKEYVKEVYYKTADTETARQYFALAFRNDKGGYELRNKYFKGSTSPKDVTTIKNGSKSVLIFEGFFDFLACVEYWNSKNKIIPYDVIVLNSVSNANKINLDKYDTIKLLLDNDTAGQNTAELLTIQYSGKTVENVTKKLFVGEFKECKDFNDYWRKVIKSIKKNVV